MIKWMLHAMARRMTEETGYDNTYLHEIIDTSTSAALKFLGLPMLSQTKGPNVELWAGAALGSVLDGDCGPCAQLRWTRRSCWVYRLIVLELVYMGTYTRQEMLVWASNSLRRQSRTVLS